MSFRQIEGRDPNYVKVKRLGKGAFGSVYKVKRKVDGKVLARKSIKLKNVTILELVHREVSALQKLVGCRNVVQWTADVAYDPTRMVIHLHMEYYPHGDLSNYIKGRSSLVSKDTVTQIFCCMAMALLDCHSRGICHRDIKPQNILLSKKKWQDQVITVAYLADFGVGKLSSVTLTSGASVDGSCVAGTPHYMAPESLNERNPIYSERSDLFSLGCTMYELCNLQPAYRGRSRTHVPDMKVTARAEYGGRLSPMIANLLDLNPARRMSTTALVRALDEYCEARWERGKVDRLWEGLTVMAPAQKGKEKEKDVQEKEKGRREKERKDREKREKDGKAGQMILARRPRAS